MVWAVVDCVVEVVVGVAVVLCKVVVVGVLVLYYVVVIVNVEKI